MEKTELSNLKRRLTRARKKLEQKNAEFAKMTKKQQRVTIAADVIADLRTRKLVADTGRYLFDSFNVTKEDGWETCKLPDDMDLAEIQYGELAEAGTCTVCGIGALFVDAVKRHDKYTADLAEAEQPSQREIHDYLGKWFSVKQLLLVESAFETREFLDDDYSGYGDDEDRTPSDEDLAAAVIFGRRFSTPDKRMKAIMKNIIENDGTFKPPKLSPKAFAAYEQERYGF